MTRLLADLARGLEAPFVRGKCFVDAEVNPLHSYEAHLCRYFIGNYVAVVPERFSGKSETCCELVHKMVLRARTQMRPCALASVCVSTT